MKKDELLNFIINNKNSWDSKKEEIMSSFENIIENHDNIELIIKIDEIMNFINILQNYVETN